jgi:hypothetical protein
VKGIARAESGAALKLCAGAPAAEIKSARLRRDKAYPRRPGFCGRDPLLYTLFTFHSFPA